MTSPSTPAPRVRICGATKRFGDLTVLEDVNLDIAEGEVAVLIGPSGAGKSTLLRCINGLERLTSGHVEIDGQRLVHKERALNEMRQHVGMVFQSFNLFPHLTAAENISLAQRTVARRSSDEARSRTMGLLDQVGLTEKADSYPSSLSGGQQQRVAIARALAMSPRVMLFDEPTSALDPELVGEVLTVMQDLASQGMTMVVVTHEMRFARRVADRVILVADRGVAEDGPPAQVLDDPQSARARTFLSRLEA
jgi:ABC-type polar amino acid transport system ATPase subunit